MNPPKRIAIAVIRREGHVVTGVRPVDVPLAGYHEFPGGKCEPNETPQAAAIRETREETNLTVRAQKELRIIRHAYEHGDLELHFWLCEIDDESEPADLSPPFRWTPLTELRSLRFPEANQDVVNMLAEQAEPPTGIIIVDHGSRRTASNEMLLAAVQNFAAHSHYGIIEPAHMELAPPDIATAFAKCVERGAQRVIVFPYFLSPGRHWSQDIPQLTEKAAQPFPDVEWLVTAPFGLHSGMSAIIADRIQNCLEAAQTSDATCDACDQDSACTFRKSSE